MTRAVAPHTVIPAQAGINDTSQQRCAIGAVVHVDACVDGGLRRHDGTDTEGLYG